MLERFLDLVGGMPEALGALALLAAAFVEYVFPPFPGDAVCLFGAFLVGRAGWSLPLVFTAVMAGNLLGFTADYAAGRWLRRRHDRAGAAAAPSPRMKTLLALEPRFRDHAALTLLANRFLPGIRAFLFLGAGFFGLPFRRVLLWGTVSALAWNALIFGAGVVLGLSWSELSGLLERYTQVLWLLLGLAALGFGFRAWRRRRAARRAASRTQEDLASGRR